MNILCESCAEIRSAINTEISLMCAKVKTTVLRLQWMAYVPIYFPYPIHQLREYCISISPPTHIHPPTNVCMILICFDRFFGERSRGDFCFSFVGTAVRRISTNKLFKIHTTLWPR